VSAGVDPAARKAIETLLMARANLGHDVARRVDLAGGGGSNLAAEPDDVAGHCHVRESQTRAQALWD